MVNVSVLNTGGQGSNHSSFFNPACTPAPGHSALLSELL